MSTDVEFTIAPITSNLATVPPIAVTPDSITATVVGSTTVSADTVTASTITSPTISQPDFNPIPNDEFVINLSEFTSNARIEVDPADELQIVLGDGIFDDLMETATKHITVQFNNGRIRGEDYAVAYVAVYQATMQAALQAWLQKGLQEKQLIAQTLAQLAISQAQMNLQANTSTAEMKLNADTTSAQMKLQADTTTAQMQLEAVSASGRMKLDADTSSAQMPVQAKLAKSQIDLQWAVALLQRDNQEALVAAQTDSEIAKKMLYIRQIEGFDEEYKHKILKLATDTYSVVASLSESALEQVPDIGVKQSIDDLYTNWVEKDLDKYKYPRPTGVIAQT